MSRFLHRPMFRRGGSTGEGITSGLRQGYKEGDHHKIEIADGLAENNLSCKNDSHVIALISDDKYGLDIPQFKRDDVSEIAKWIMKKFL